jgi:hypothetical protein
MSHQITLGRKPCGQPSRTSASHRQHLHHLRGNTVRGLPVHRCSASSNRRLVRVAAAGAGDKATHGAPRPDDAESNAELIGKAIQYDIERVDVPDSQTRVSQLILTGFCMSYYSNSSARVLPCECVVDLAAVYNNDDGTLWQGCFC